MDDFASSCTTDSSGMCTLPVLLHRRQYCYPGAFQTIIWRSSGDAFLVKLLQGPKEYGQHTMGGTDDGVTGCIADR